MPPKTKTLDWAAEVTLVSQDGQKFKIKKYHLLSGSSFFRDMFEHPGTITGPTTKDNSDGTAIDLDIPSEALGVLVDLLQQQKFDSPLDWTVYRDVVMACDKYDMEAAAERAVAQIKTFVRRAPWEIFCFASKMDEPSLARRALRYMGEDKLVGQCQIAHLPLEAINECALSYYAGLVATIPTSADTSPKRSRTSAEGFKFTSGWKFGDATEQCTDAADWVSVSRVFEPIRAGKKRSLA